VAAENDHAPACRLYESAYKKKLFSCFGVAGNLLIGYDGYLREYLSGFNSRFMIAKSRMEC